MNTVRIRDYVEGETIPARLANTDYDVMLSLEDRQYEAWRPDETDAQQYNLYIMVDGVVFQVQNIDFE